MLLRVVDWSFGGVVGSKFDWCVWLPSPLLRLVRGDPMPLVGVYEAYTISLALTGSSDRAGVHTSRVQQRRGRHDTYFDRAEPLTAI